MVIDLDGLLDQRSNDRVPSGVWIHKGELEFPFSRAVLGIAALCLG